ncbi:MAG: hypothetical protein ACK4WM_06370 [Thermoflexales bacterium]
MNIRDLFVARPADYHRVRALQPGKRQVKEPQDAPASGVPVFITPQALLTFPIATFVVKLVDVVFDSLVPALADSNVIPFAAALIIGGVIMYYSWDSEVPSKDKVLRIVVGVVNVLYLYAAAKGLIEMLLG